MVRKEQLIALLNHGQHEMLCLADDLTSQEREQSGSIDHWGPRDLLGHVAEWKRRMAENMAAARLGTQLPAEEPYLEVNDQVYILYNQRPWADFLDLMNQSHRLILEELGHLTEEELNDAQRFAWTGGAPVWRRLAGNGFLHLMVHVGAARIDRGDLAYATRMLEQAYPMSAALDDQPDWQAMHVYDLGCHYALIAEKDKALRQIEQAFVLNPALAAWAKEDPDLTSLRGEPAFQSLLGRNSPAN